VHPQSVVHSMIEMIDGSIIAQMGVTDMRHAIQYALTFPERKENLLAPLDFTKISQLNFETPDFERFPCLGLAYRALNAGGTMPAALNAANEIAVQAFLDDKIGLSDIPRIIESVMNEYEPQAASSLEAIQKADDFARNRAIMKLEKTASAI
jgi:1-deoxy-D-xylulose-5-phosphate reductoisomerase